jgi:hypothetical protein
MPDPTWPEDYYRDPDSEEPDCGFVWYTHEIREDDSRHVCMLVQSHSSSHECLCGEQYD